VANSPLRPALVREGRGRRRATDQIADSPRGQGTATAEADVALEKAEATLAEGRVVDACGLGQRALAHAPRVAASWLFLGQCYMRLGQSERARSYYRGYLDIAPNAPNAPFVRTIVDASP
jgi:Flp pilus assembly protein TadD